MEREQLRRLRSALRSGIRGIRATPIIFTLSVSSMAAGLLLVGTYLLVVQNMQQVLDRFGNELRIVAFLEPGAQPSPAKVAELRSRFEAFDGVSQVRFVDSSQALERLRSDLGREAGILEGLEANPLPASFEITLAADARSARSIEPLAARIAESEAIDDVRWGEDWVQGYSRLLRAVAWLGAALGAFLMLVLCTVVAGTVRLALYARTDEIQIQRLVGASGLFVRLPFYLEGALQGTAAAGLALALLYGLFQLGLPILGDLLAFLLGHATPSFFGASQIVLIFLIGVGLGVGGSVLSLVRLEETR